MDTGRIFRGEHFKKEPHKNHGFFMDFAYEYAEYCQSTGNDEPMEILDWLEDPFVSWEAKWDRALRETGRR